MSLVPQHITFCINERIVCTPKGQRRTEYWLGESQARNKQHNEKGFVERECLIETQKQWGNQRLPRGREECHQAFVAPFVDTVVTGKARWFSMAAHVSGVCWNRQWCHAFLTRCAVMESIASRHMQKDMRSLSGSRLLWKAKLPRFVVVSPACASPQISAWLFLQTYQFQALSKHSLILPKRG